MNFAHNARKIDRELKEAARESQVVAAGFLWPEGENGCAIEISKKSIEYKNHSCHAFDTKTSARGVDSGTKRNAQDRRCAAHLTDAGLQALCLLRTRLPVRWTAEPCLQEGPGGNWWEQSCQPSSN
ncbi:hypothetical protein P9A16_28790 [Shinella sp. 838]|jgi:hypothetical protein|uniref:hypothetical protein n=1 Tax=unclassified Shinella TaxID=2643062 RepID=UPI0012DC3EA7|nr:MULTISPECIES: hypothetical protein [unclassified Shinella]MDG4675123.1 hypothetical protein [Shinella sp. 838]